MRGFIAAALLTATLSSDLPIVNEADFTQSWFDNKVDHFNYQSTATYKQRYWQNDTYCSN